jgi:sigma-E factor negative regulatory protein RseC
MEKSSSFHHPGVVKKIENDIIYIDIEVMSACAQCHANSYCSALGKKEKVIEVSVLKYPNFKVDDNVNVMIKEILGMHALGLGYIMPVVVLLIALFVSFYITNNEGVSAIITLVLVVFYYFLLWVFRKKIQKHFTIEVEKL